MSLDLLEIPLPGKRLVPPRQNLGDAGSVSASPSVVPG